MATCCDEDQLTWDKKKNVRKHKYWIVRFCRFLWNSLSFIDKQFHLLTFLVGW